MALTFSLTPQDDTWNQAVGEAELGAPITEDVEVIALEGNDTVTGTAFNDLLLGNQGNDSLDGGQGNDTVYGGQGNDFVTSASGNNLLLGNFGDDTIIGGTGNDTIFGGQDNDSIEATAGDNEIYGNLGDDTIIGGTGNDVLHGGQGNDRIEAGTGATKTLIGGLGDDTFVFGAGTAAGATVNGNRPDGTGEGNNTILVTGDNDFSNTPFDNISTISVDEGATAEFNLFSLEDVTTLTGGGIIQINASNALVRAYLDSLGENLGADVTILDEEGNVVTQTPPFVPDNPEDPDKLRPIQANFTLDQDNVVFAGRANAPLATAGGIFNNVTLQSIDLGRGTGDNDVLTAEIGSNTRDTIIPVINPQLDGVETLNFTTTFAGANIGIVPVVDTPVFNGSRTTGTNTIVYSDSTSGLSVQNFRNIVDVVLRNHIAVQGFGDTEIIFNPDVSSPELNISLENSRSPLTAFRVGGGSSTYNITSTQVEGSDAAVNNQLGAIIGGAGTVNITGDQNLSLSNVSERVVGPVASLPPSASMINAGGVFDGEGNPIIPTFEANLTLARLSPNGDLEFMGGNGNDTVSAITTQTDLTVDGGAGDDRFNFINPDVDATQINRGTLDEDDVIDGGEGNDVVRAAFARRDNIVINGTIAEIITDRGTLPVVDQERLGTGGLPVFSDPTPATLGEFLRDERDLQVTFGNGTTVNVPVFVDENAVSEEITTPFETTVSPDNTEGGNITESEDIDFKRFVSTNPNDGIQEILVGARTRRVASANGVAGQQIPVYQVVLDDGSVLTYSWGFGGYDYNDIDSISGGTPTAGTARGQNDPSLPSDGSIEPGYFLVDPNNNFVAIGQQVPINGSGDPNTNPPLQNIPANVLDAIELFAGPDNTFDPNAVPAGDFIGEGSQFLSWQFDANGFVLDVNGNFVDPSTVASDAFVPAFVVVNPDNDFLPTGDDVVANPGNQDIDLSNLQQEFQVGDPATLQPVVTESLLEYGFAVNGASTSMSNEPGSSLRISNVETLELEVNATVENLNQLLTNPEVDLVVLQDLLANVGLDLGNAPYAQGSLVANPNILSPNFVDATDRFGTFPGGFIGPIPPVPAPATGLVADYINEIFPLNLIGTFRIPEDVNAYNDFVTTLARNLTVTIPMNDVTGLQNLIILPTISGGIAEITGIPAVPDTFIRPNGDGLANGISMNGTAGVDTFNVTYEGGNDPIDAGVVRTEIIENINIVVEGNDISFFPDFDGAGINGDRILRTVTIASENDVEVGAIETTDRAALTRRDSITSVDASAVEGEFVATSASLAPNAQVTLGQQDSFFDATGSAFSSGDEFLEQIEFNPNGIGVDITGQGGNDTIVGSAFDDTITGGTGADELIGNGGNDLFVYDSLSDSLFANPDTIIDFTEGDPLTAPDADAIRVPESVRLDLPIFDAGFVGNIILPNVQNALTNLQANQVGVFNNGANTFVVFNDGNQGFNAGSDSFIVLNGVIGDVNSIEFIGATAV